ncbi:MAG: ABC transporter ATP-binding protein [Pleomorphochaeta sp.]
MSTKLELKNLVKHYEGNPLPSVEDMNITIEPGEMIAFLGPSGCGKTTTLRMIAGLIEPTEGDVLFNGESVLDIPPRKREVSMVFQKAMLFPHMSIYDNVAFGLKMRKRPKDEIEKKVNQMLDFVQLNGYGKKKPTQLSGGQEQRVSLARGLVIEPKIFLLDEPLSALDAKLRIEMRDMILSIQRELGVTSIFVTHDQEEAVMLSDRIALMFDGKLQQFDKPEMFYRKPRTKRIAEFFGCSNFVKGIQRGNTVETEFGTVTLKELPKDNRDVYLVVRNECFEVSEESDAMQAKITSRIFMGTSVRYVFDINGVSLQATMDNAASYDVGDTVGLTFIEDKLWAVAQDDTI